ncbi:MAG: ATP-binding protein [Acidobacteriota bacterium]
MKSRRRSLDLREELLRRRKDGRFIVGGLTALLVVCGFVYYMLQRGRGLPAELATNQLLIFVLWYVNLILILTVLLILVRSFFRLLLERHHRILGSKFKTKLVLTAISLSLIPVLILFPFATRLLLDAFDQWFSLPVDEVVTQAQEIATYLDEEIRRNNLRAGKQVLERVVEVDLSDAAQHVALANELGSLREELQVDYLAVFDGTSFIRGAADLSVGFRREPDFRGRTDFLEEAMREGSAWRIPEETLDVDGRLLLSACARPRASSAADAESGAEAEGAPGGEAPSTVVVTGTLLPPDIAAQSEFLSRSYLSYLQLRVRREDLRAIFLSILLMVSLLVILAFSSIGLRLARRITLPIQALADGTRRISEGDLDHKVRVAVDDELGVLVDGFNSMTSELKRNRELVDRQYRELTQANKRLAAVLQNVAAGVVAIDAGGVILTCNGAALDILAQRESEVVGRPVAEAWPDEERGRLVRLLDEDFSAGGQMRRQLQMTIGGVWKTLEAKVTTLPDSEGRFGGRVLVLEDLTELIHAQKMATWNEVARRIAHEIKNPLTPIQLTAERLLRKHEQGDPSLGETLERGVATIVREVKGLKTLVDEFSRFARMPRPRPRVVDLETLFDELTSLYRGLRPGLEVGAELGLEAGEVRFDPEQLKGVLINLIDNAVEALDGPGQVTLSSERSGSKLLIRVADTGRGIALEDREKLFLPYYSTKGRGSGLGLSIVHRVVADHHGQIHVQENAPRGAIFLLEMPAV